MLLKIGELARRTGLSVRTLHHYDAIALLQPSARSAAGYRLYDRKDIARLHRIQALRRLDLSLAEIASLLEDDRAGLDSVIDRQIAMLDEQVARAAALRDRLAALRTHLRAREEPVLDDWLATLAMMNFHDRYFTPEEREQLRRSGSADDGALHQVKQELRRLMEEGAPPASAPTQALARRWIALSVRHLGGDARLLHKTDTLHRREPHVHMMTGIDAALLDYLTRATAEYRLSLYARHLDPDAMPAVRERFLAHYLEWPALFAQARELQERGADPLAPETLELAARWMALFQAVWGGDPRIHQQVFRANEVEPELIAGLGIDDGAVRLVRAAIDHLKQQKTMEKA